jgi:hypothetical protein
MFSSILRIIGKSPNSLSISDATEPAGLFLHLVDPQPRDQTGASGTSLSFHTQVLSGFAHTSSSSGLIAATLNAVLWLTLLNVRTQSPTAGRWNSG